MIVNLDKWTITFNRKASWNQLSDKIIKVDMNYSLYGERLFIFISMGNY